MDKRHFCGVILGIQVLSLWTVTGSLRAEEVDIPKGYAPERYERIWKKSPFTVASVIETKADTSNFTDSLTLVGLVTIGDKPLVTIRSNDSQQDELIEADKPSASGLQVVSFVNDLDPTKVQVVLKKGDSSGTMHFTINETAPVIAQNTGQNELQTPRPVPPITIPRPSAQRNVPRNSAPMMPAPGNAPSFRKRPIALPGSRSATPNRANPPQRNVIPPP